MNKVHFLDKQSQRLITVPFCKCNMNKEPLHFLYFVHCNHNQVKKCFSPEKLVFTALFSLFISLCCLWLTLSILVNVFYLLYYIFGESKFFSMCQGMTRSACAFDAQDLCNTTGVISMCIRFFPFFLNSYDPNIGRTMTSFSNVIN